MADVATRSNVSALNPEFWSSIMQVPLRKSLVAGAVADTRFESVLTMGDTVHYPYWDELSVTDYTPGTDITGAEDVTGTDESLTINQKKVVRFYVDDIEAMQAKYSFAMTLAEEGAYKLRDAIDTHILLNVTGAASALDDGDIGGTSGSAITATSGNVADVYVQARRKMRQMNVEDDGGWISVVTPAFAAHIERMASDAGFSVADATLRNGFAGTYLGFRIYISNNLPSAAYGGTNSDYCYIGRQGQIHAVIQKAPTMIIRDAEKRLGRYFYPHTVYGSKVFEKHKYRFLKVPIEI
ncbi:MAG: hypothetical protein R6V13_05935 [Anaerolineae bacterium]